MKPTDAVALVNWWPLPTEVMMRKGYTAHLTGGAAQVESLMAYHGGTPKLFAAAGTAIYDATSTGTSFPAASVSTLTNARWQHVNFGTSGGQFLVICNGADSVRTFDGSAWATPAITNVTSSTLIAVCAHVQRLFFVESGTMRIWYLPAGAVAGAAASIDVGAYAQLGGSVQAIGSWTIDAGEGMDDHFVAVTTKGEVMVYKGSDPASATTWGLVGRFRIGAPLGRRCLMKLGGDLAVLTQDGVVPLSRALMTNQTRPDVALSDRIRDAVLVATNAYSAQYGWELEYYPAASMLICNVPITAGSQVEQFVMNTQTGAWARWTGMHANCWEVFEGNLYFGASSAVYRGWNGYADNGTNIESLARGAYLAYGANGRTKRFTMARPLFRASGTPSVAISINVDFADVDPVATISFSSSASAGIWGAGLWGTMKWGGSALTLYRPWKNLSGIGHWGAVVVKSVSQGIDVRWGGTEIVYEFGGMI